MLVMVFRLICAVCNDSLPVMAFTVRLWQHLRVSMMSPCIYINGPQCCLSDLSDCLTVFSANFKLAIQVTQNM